jgi:hypothetical protein
MASPMTPIAIAMPLSPGSPAGSSRSRVAAKATIAMVHAGIAIAAAVKTRVRAGSIQTTTARPRMAAIAAPREPVRKTTTTTGTVAASASSL